MIRSTAVAALVLSASLAGCGVPSGGASRGMMVGGGEMPDMEQKQDLMQKLMADPQVPAWYGERERITQAMGDRVFDKEFDRVFDSLTVALASMEANVNNMERQSGYITAAVPRLNPERAEQLRKAAMVAFAQHHGHD